MMDALCLGAVLRTAKRDLFRLETLDFYEPDREGYERWQAGDGLDEAIMGPWLDRLRAEKARGLRRRRVHVLRSPLAPYLRFECEVYARNSEAGEETRILDLTTMTHPLALASWRDDFWAIDGQDVAVMAYGRGGRFDGALVDPLAASRAVYFAVRDAAWEAAKPFEAWWDAHREYHRGQKVA